MQRTKIEYLDYTWSPIAMRCTPKSSGCLFCWHLRVADRLMNNPKMPKEKRDAWAGGEYVFDEKELGLHFSNICSFRTAKAQPRQQIDN